VRPGIAVGVELDAGAELEAEAEAGIGADAEASVHSSAPVVLADFVPWLLGTSSLGSACPCSVLHIQGTAGVIHSPLTARGSRSSVVL
jgi:hypothetical protein